MSHPNVLCPLVKEIVSGDPISWTPFYPTVQAVRRHARRHGVALCPYIAPNIHRFDVPIALAKLRPETKIVINLRNPVDLAFSTWKWFVLHMDRSSLRNDPSLAIFSAFVDKALEVFPAPISPFYFVLHSGIYWSSVQQWLRCFRDDHVVVFDISEYFTDRRNYMERVERFLGLPHVPLHHDLPIAHRNPLELPAPQAETREKLRAFFQPYNRRLWDVIHTEYSW